MECYEDLFLFSDISICFNLLIIQTFLLKAHINLIQLSNICDVITIKLFSKVRKQKNPPKIKRFH